MSRFSYHSYPPYVSVAERKELAKKEMQKLQKTGKVLNPVFVEGRTISNTFWGKAWCKHIETFQDYENRLPRGRTYLRSGTVIDLSITEGLILATVSGFANYEVRISVAALDSEKWQDIVSTCTGQIDSVVALLQGTFSKPIMERMTNTKTGLFPTSQEVSLKCSCPDFAQLCKHIAAVLYGIGSRLDHSPESLFTLRSVDPLDLLQAPLIDTLVSQQEFSGLEGDLSDLFGIDLVESSSAIKKSKPKKEPVFKPSPKTKKRSVKRPT